MESLGTQQTFKAANRKTEQTEGEDPMSTTMKSKFCLGQLVATPAALEALQRNNVTGHGYIRRHAAGDWGELSDHDAHMNDLAVEDGSKILSAYRLPDETKVWVITDSEVDEKHNREVTTILLPEDY